MCFYKIFWADFQHVKKYFSKHDFCHGLAYCTAISLLSLSVTKYTQLSRVA